VRPPTLAVALALVVVLVSVDRAPAGERVDITAMDGTQLIGDLGGASGPGVVLTDAASAARDHWKTVATTIAGRGFRVLRVDLRGHGESSGVPDATAADRDLEGAYRYLLGRKIRPVFLVATDASAAAALAVAARVPVAGVALIGATAKDGGATVPVLVLPSDSAEAIDSLVQWLSDPQRK
jgi:pimeloyl-ACP methyl ester carboxylesterase